jgi:hypothetical protein
MLSPILAPQSRRTSELATIAGDDDKRAAARVAGDQNIVSPYHSTLALERRADVRRVMRRSDVERQDLKLAAKFSTSRRLASGRADCAAACKS